MLQCWQEITFLSGIGWKDLLWHSKLKGFIPPQGFIDHFTIEPDFKAWHITALINGQKEERRKWVPSFKLFELQPDVFFWFGLSVWDTSELELTPTEIKWHFTSLPKDSKRKLDIVRKSREGAKFHILQLPQGQKINNQNTFLHFDVLIDRRRFSWFKKFDLKSVAPFCKPALIEKVKPNLQFIARTHKIRLKKFNGTIKIGVSQHSGRLSEKAIITNPEI